MLELTDDRVRGQVTVRDELKQPFGLVHGGVYAAIAESLASFATGAVVRPGGEDTGLSNQTSVLRPITEGTIHARRGPQAPGADDLGVGGRDLRRRGTGCACSAA